VSVAQVARSEGQLLTLTRALFDGTPPSVVAPLVVDTQKLEDRIGPTAMGVLQSTLAKGTVRALVHGGGWRRESRPIVPPELSDGRIWDRHEPPALHFTGWSYALLAALLRHAGTKPGTLRPPSEPGDGDHLLAFQVARMLVALELPEPLALVRFSPLVQLGFAWYVDPLDDAFDWAGWLKGRTWMIEGLHDALADAWARAERRRSQVRTTERLVRRSKRQRAVFMGVLDAFDTLGRPDLQDVFLSAGERLVPDPTNAAAGQALVPALDPAQPLSARAEALRAAVAFVDALDRVRRSVDATRSVRFFDDDYDLSQARLARWEQFGNERMRVFAGLRDQLASGGI
jgi:hypothetical protein